MTQNAAAAADPRVVFARAQECEQRGLLADAVRGYLAAGAVEHAARVLARMGHFFDAAHLLLSLVQRDPATDPECARLAQNAAACLAHGGDREGADEIMRRLQTVQRVSVNPPARAPAAKREAGEPAREQGDSEAYGVGANKIRAGAFREGLDALVTISQSSAHYRNACVYAIHASCRLLDMSFAMDNFVAPFARSDPRDRNEAQALVALGGLYAHQGFVEEARETYERVLRLHPQEESVRRKLAELAVPEPVTSMHAIEESVIFWSERKSEQPSSATTPHLAPASRAPSAVIRPGLLIANRYLVEAELGRGGMGLVFAASDRDLGERVAIKSFLNRVDDQNVIARFKQELSVSRKLSHDNIIRLHDMGVHDGRLFLTMELLSGKTLRQSAPEMGLRERLLALRQLAVGVSAIHEKSVVHRDLKPANIFITDDGVLKVMDFGLAKLTSAAVEGLTASGFAAGTPGYMPPEQVMSFGTVSSTADVYAVGVIAYELLAGYRPFRHADASQIIRLQFTMDAASICETVPDISPLLDAVILRMLSREPAQRAPLSELASALRTVLSA